MTTLLEELAAAPSPSELPLLLPGATVGRFEIVRQLGRGAFGVVYEARDRDLYRSVALKVVQPAKAGAWGGALIREAEAVARLSHPCLVTLFEVGRSDAGPYLVFELLRGRTMEQRLDEGPVATAEAVRLASEVARGLAHAHGEGVVHRDLKPTNVFLTEGGQVKILDFGMAHAFGRRRLAGGTPAYMAPEQWQGAPEDERTDVFALGVLLHRMLAGEHPFPDDEGRWASSPSWAPRLAVRGAPELEGLVASMLARAPTDRPRDGAAVVAALEPIAERLRSEPAAGPARVQAREPATPSAGEPTPRRRVTARLVGALALVAAVAAVAVYAGRARHEQPQAPGPPPAASIAVIPFADMSPAHDQEYFADGVAEEILNALAHVQGMKVIGRTSSFSFRNKADDLRDIGQKLGVAHVLEGSLRKDGNDIRVTAQLVRVSDGSHVWSATYDRKLEGIFKVQDEIARAVVEALVGRLLAPRSARSPDERTSSLEAYRLLLLGRHLDRAGAPEGYKGAVEALSLAAQLDPEYGPAHAALGFAIWSRALTDAVDTTRPFAEALARAERAIRLAPDLADGYALRGHLRTYGSWDWPGAQSDLERALALAPGGDSMARASMAFLQGARGRVPEALRLAREAWESDPLNPVTVRWVGAFEAASGSPERAAGALRRGLEVAPGHAYLMRELVFALLLAKRPGEALEVARSIPVPWMRTLGEALALHALGDDAGSRRALAKLGDGGPALAYQIAQIHAWREERAEAFHWLEQAFALNDPGLRYLRYDPLLRGLRADPRFRALVRKMGLPAD